MENKPYRFKFIDDKKHHIMTNSEKDKSPAKKKKWCLINNTTDKSLMRTLIANEVSRKVGMSFVPYARSCDVFLNGEYRGNYLIMDYLDVNKNRIDIDEMETTDVEGEELTGGYFLECDGYAGTDKSDNYFFTSRNNGFTIRSPETDVLQPVQFEYIKTHMQKLEDKLFSDNFKDSISGYRSMLDINSFLNYFLVSEFNGNNDMLWQWFFIKQRSDDRFYIGPVWDAELSMDNYAYLYPQNKNQTWTYLRKPGTVKAVPFVSRVLSDPYAISQLEKKWDRLRTDSIFTTKLTNEIVDSCVTLLSQSQRLHFMRWPYLDLKINNNAKIWGTWELEVENVRHFLNERISWMDRNLRYQCLTKIDDCYQIESPRDLYTFAYLVNSGENKACAILKEDIDMSDYSNEFVQIGTPECPYVGSFDGNSHKIKNLHIQGENAALFGVLGSGAKLSGFYLDESCSVLGKQTASAVAAVVDGTDVVISCCGNSADIQSTQGNAAGLVGLVLSGNLQLNNCFNSGYIKAPIVADMVSETADVQIVRCYNIGVLEGSLDSKAQAITSTFSDALSGSLCYTLNIGSESAPLYFQNLDNGEESDNYPLPFPNHAKVYQQDSKFTNNRSVPSKYQYYQLKVLANKGDKYLQFSEFDLLDIENNEITPMKVYAGSYGDTNKQGWPQVADNDTGSKYCMSFKEPVYFLFDTKQEVLINGYRITTANDTKGYPGRNPSDWVLSGSKIYSEDPNAECWQVIDTHNNDIVMGAENYKPYDFLMSNKILDMHFVDESLVLYSGDRVNARLVIAPVSLSNTKIEYSSTDEDVVRINSNGVIETVGNGHAEIIARAINCAGESARMPVDVTGYEDPGYRFFMLKVDDINYNSMKVKNLQLSEFGLLHNDAEIIPDLSIYEGEIGTYANQGYANLTDGSVYTKVCLSFCGNASFYFATPYRVVPVGYRMITADDTKLYASSPKSWSLWGTNVFSTHNYDECWTLLDRRVDDISFVNADNFTSFDFRFDENTAIHSPECPFSSFIDYDLAGRRVPYKKRGVYLHHNEKGEMRKVLY